jgi:hypothetical protein
MKGFWNWTVSAGERRVYCVWYVREEVGWPMAGWLVVPSTDVKIRERHSSMLPLE